MHLVAKSNNYKAIADKPEQRRTLPRTTPVRATLNEMWTDRKNIMFTS